LIYCTLHSFFSILECNFIKKKSARIFFFFFSFLKDFIFPTRVDPGHLGEQRIAAIPRQSRTATGVLVQRLDGGSTISEVALVAAQAEAASTSSQVVEPVLADA